MMVCLLSNTTCSQHKCIGVGVWLLLSYIQIVLTIVCHHSVLCKTSPDRHYANKSLERQFHTNWTSYTTVNYDILTTNNGSIASNVSAVETNKSLQLSNNESNVCKVCWCSKKDTLDCRRADKLDSLPAMPIRTDRLLITEM